MALTFSNVTFSRGWIVWSALAGALPLLLAWPLGVWWHQLVAGVVVWALFLPAVVKDDTARGVGVLAVGFAAHCATAIALSAVYGAAVSGLFPDADAYWAQQQVWIRTGVDPEYVVANWGPAHFQLLAAMVVFAALSLGLTPLVQGMHEVDLMNYYVGNLVQGSTSTSTALLLGWHPWSVMRGLCYLFLTFEVASAVLSWWSGTSLSTTTRRRWRWALGLCFFSLDGLLKLFLLPGVRDALQANFP